MEEQADNLVMQLEAEGQEIAKCRKLILDMLQSGQKIDCSRMLSLCNHLNEHISTFDEISEQLDTLENDFSL